MRFPLLKAVFTRRGSHLAASAQSFPDDFRAGQDDGRQNVHGVIRSLSDSLRSVLGSAHNLSPLQRDLAREALELGDAVVNGGSICSVKKAGQHQA